MQDKFTRSARLAIEKAKEFSKSLGHGYVGTEHLLYGLMKTKGSMAEIVLKNHAITEEKLYKTIEVSFATHSMVLVKDAPEFSIRAVRVLENSAKEAKKTDSKKSGSTNYAAVVGGVVVVIIVIAGMEGALASVVGGLVEVPVIAVPTSVGYGASFGGLAALLSMLNSCANGIGVVNIDNGYGAACLANKIMKR